MNTITTLFPHVIGQHPAKRKFEFYIKSFEKTGIVPNIMITAPKGAGKTMLARAFARNLLMEVKVEKDAIDLVGSDHSDAVLYEAADTGTFTTTEIRPKKYHEINCATIKNLKQFVEEIMIPCMQDKYATFLFDECHMLPKDVTMALLTITNPNKGNYNNFSYGGSEVEIDFKRLTFLFATTEPQEVFHALIDRMERIDLDDYSYDELGQILMLNTEKVTFEGDLLSKHIAPTLRGNGRAAQKMATNINNYVVQNDQMFDGMAIFTHKHWRRLCTTLDIMPHGINKIELRYLRALHRDGCIRLYNLAAKLGMTRAAIQSDAEVYLQKLNFIDVTVRGRELSKDAREMFEKHPELLEKGKSS